MSHISVLLHETIDALLAGRNTGTYVDGTFGRGGHTRLLLSKLDENARVYAFDKDPQALAVAAELEQEDSRFKIIHASFADLKEALAELGIEHVDGVMADLGVSSPQLDDAERGFSFMRDGPLDMRMDTTKGLSAAEWLDQVSIEDLTWVLKEFGEERFAKRIATAIVNFNRTSGQKITRTLQLAQIISDAVPFKDKHKHPATRSFQAIRIFINSELEELAQALQSAIEVLAPQGRLSIISFHSLEDRMVKQFIKKNSKGKEVPRGLPILESELNKDIPLKAIGKAIMPSEEEIRENPRSRSAVLRVAEKR